ncbi:MAG: hypothetical protein H6550_01605 [Chitinophagales bacterium]|nr:hypothetical protein [Chitinophagales bacterium]
MNRINLITIAILLVSSPVFAQNFSFGARAGVGNTYDMSSLKSGVLDKSLDKELFLRYQSKGRLAFEVSCIQYNGTHTTPAQIFDCRWGETEPPTSTDGGSNALSNYVDLNLSAQYDISCPYIQEHCPVMKHLRSFIGINIGARYQSSTNKHYVISLSDGSISQEITRYKEINTPQAGLTHTLTYSFGKFYASSVASFYIRPWDMSAMYMNSSIYPDSKLSLRLGLGYRL